MEARCCAHRTESIRVVRHDSSIMGFGQCSDLLGMSDPANHAYIRTNVLHSAFTKERFKLVDVSDR